MTILVAILFMRPSEDFPRRLCPRIRTKVNRYAFTAGAVNTTGFKDSVQTPD
jgi:hypothetical protein